MKNLKKNYIIIWAIALVVFNAVVFAASSMVKTVNMFTASFWIAYAFVLLAFAGNLGCGLYFFNNSESKEKAFLNFHIINIAYTSLVLSAVLGAVIMAIPVITNAIAVIVAVIMLAVFAVAVVKTKTAADVVEAADKKVKVQTFFIKSLTVNAQTLMAKATTDEARAEAKKVYEALRYSAPMSSEALSGVESQITIKFNQFASAVESNASSIKDLSEELEILIKDRNSKCRLLK